MRTLGYRLFFVLHLDGMGNFFFFSCAMMMMLGGLERVVGAEVEEGEGEGGGMWIV